MVEYLYYILVSVLTKSTMPLTFGSQTADFCILEA